MMSSLAPVLGAALVLGVGLVVGHGLAAAGEPTASASAATEAAAEAAASEVDAGPVSATDDADVDVPSFTGNFRFSGGEVERQGVAEAIERAVEALPSIFHELARKRLGRANTIPDRVVMTMKGDELEIVYGDLEPMRAPLDGSVRHWHNREGTQVNLTLEQRGDTLVQTTWSSGGRRVVRWTLGNEGRRLRMRSSMSSPRLPVAIEYRLTFRR